jgi:hypothetical protein
MAIQFAKYERTESTLESQGTVMDLVGKDGFLELIPKNLRDTSKRVVVILKKKNGQSAMVTCSQQVSDGLRDKTIELGHVINFEILEGESGVPFISMPGGALISIAVKSLVAKDYVAQAISLEDIIA